MKRIFLLWSIAFCFGNSFAGDKEIIKSELSEVTVYSNGAQMYRKANFSAKPGITEFIIEGVSPNIDPKSLQVKASGSVIIIDSKYSTYYPEPVKPKLDGLPLKIRNDIRLLQDSIENVNFTLKEIQDEIDVLNTSKNILANNGAIRGQGKVNDSIQLLKQAMEYYQIKMNELNKKIQVLQRKKTEQNEKLSGMNARLSDLQNYQSSNEPVVQTGPIHRISITVQCKEAVTGKFAVSYLVSGAGWTPSYDLRADIVTGKVNLTYKAAIHQTTGEKWDDVRLTLSTNNPYQNKTKPELHPWYIDYTYHYNEGRLNNAGVTYDLKKPQAYQELAKEDVFTGNAQSSMDFMTMVDRVIAAEYKIDLPYTIDSDGEQHLVLVKTTDVNANYRYYTVPKIEPGVYLVAEILKLDELQLVPAKANIFFDGTYMGETYIDPTTMNDTLTLSLGKDPNIIARRIVLKQDIKDKIVGNDRERTMSYEISLKNLKNTDIKLVVEDQIPVSTNGEIVIEAVETSKADYDPVSGKLKWVIDLKSKDSKRIVYSFKVKNPKDKDLIF